MILSGTLSHRDSTGIVHQIKKDDVKFMTSKESQLFMDHYFRLLTQAYSPHSLKPGIVTYNASDSSSFPLGTCKNKGVILINIAPLFSELKCEFLERK